MAKFSYVKRTSLTAMFIAFCVILPMAFHAVGLGSTFAPMHIPVLMCGLISGGAYGLICGMVGPLLSSVITGMPGAAMLPSMVPELMAYGLVSGLLMKRVRTGKLYADLYISLGAAMLIGRVVAGIAKMLLFMGGEGYSLGLWISAHFVTAAPGIVCHLVVIPILISTLMRAKLIPKRY
jgi:hypothetical protein